MAASRVRVMGASSAPFYVSALFGALFGVSAEQRPFGDDVLTHPIVLLFVVVAIGLLVLRFVLRRPVQRACALMATAGRAGH